MHFTQKKQDNVDILMPLNDAHPLFRAKQIHVQLSRTCKQTEKSL